MAQVLRSKSMSFVRFSKPLVGPTGYVLTGYEWSYKVIDAPNAEGDFVVKRVSDWDNADRSVLTGRDLVHKFHVTDSMGNTHIYSAESVLEVLGFVSDSQTHARVEARTVMSDARRLGVMYLKLAAFERQRQLALDLLSNIVYPEIKDKPVTDLFPHVQQRVLSGALRVYTMGSATCFQEPAGDAPTADTISSLQCDFRISALHAAGLSQVPHYDSKIAELTKKIKKLESML